MLGLAGRGLGQLGAAVADLAGEQSGQPVEVALAVLVVDPDAFAPDDDRDLARCGDIRVKCIHRWRWALSCSASLESCGHLVPQV